MKTSPQIRDEEENLNFSKSPKKARCSAAEKCESFIEIKFEDRSNDFRERLTLLEIRLCGDFEPNNGETPESDACEPQSSEAESEAESEPKQIESELPEDFELNNFISESEGSSETNISQSSDGESATQSKSKQKEIPLPEDLEPNNSVPQNDTSEPHSPEVESETQSKLQDVENNIPVFHIAMAQNDTSETQSPEVKSFQVGENNTPVRESNRNNKTVLASNARARKIMKKKIVKIYVCQICAVKFKERYRMLHHLRTHTGEKPFSCEICEAKFFKHQEAKKHMTIHSGDKPFVIIENEFADRVRLGRPLKIRHKMKDYECQICHSKFVRHDHLRRHLKIHSFQKSHGCSMCDSTFVKRSDLLAHLSVHVFKDDDEVFQGNG